MAGAELSPGDCRAHVVVTLRGELDAANAADAAVAVTAAGKHVIVDLAALEFMDCCALGALLGVRELARRAGGDVLLAAPQRLVLRLLDLVGVPGVYASVAAAADSVGWSRRAAVQLAAGHAPGQDSAPRPYARTGR